MSLGVAILGSGQAAEIHSKALRAVAPTVRRWYASRDASRARAMAARWGGDHVETYEAALASPDIHALILAVPPALHLEWTERALDARKHVVVEKPPFLTTRQFDEAEARARRAGRQLLVAENYFYKPLTTLLRLSIGRGDLGEVLFIQLNALKRQRTEDWRDDDKLAGGGALFEGGIHWVSLMANIGLTPVRSRALFPAAGRTGKAGTAGRAGDRNAVVTIEYAEGAVATLAYSWDLPGLINGVRMSRAYGTGGVLRFETNGLFAVLAGKRHRLFFPGAVNLAGYRAMTRDFITAIEQNRPPAYNLTLARRDLHLVSEAYASASGSHHT